VRAVEIRAEKRKVKTMSLKILTCQEEEERRRTQKMMRNM
jgi:hypothetical protein